MKVLKEEELKDIDGGLSITGTLLNSVSTIMKTISDLGRMVGSAVRRLTSNNLCKL